MVSLALCNRTKFGGTRGESPQVCMKHGKESNANSDRGSASLEFSSAGPGSLPAWRTDCQRSVASEKEMW